MSRGYFENSKGTTFLNFRESDSVGHGDGVDHGVDCLGGRLQQPPGPFHYLISEQAKSLVVLQELQHEVGALLEFRDLVMETFPNLRTKLNQQQSANSTPATMTGHHHLHHSNIPISIRPSEWTPGVRIRKKLGISNNNNNSNKEKKSGNSDSATTAAVQDSGFSTEASSKETHSASSTLPTSTSATGNSETDDTEDELWNLLDIIDKKGTRLKNEVESLQNTLRDQTPFNNSSGNFQRALFHSSADDHHVKQLRQERDYLLDRLAEMEAEVLAGRLHAARLQEDLENLLSARHDLEEQLKAILTQRGAVNSRIHDLHLQFVAKSSSDEKLKLFSSGSSDRKDSSSQLPGSPVWTLIKRHYSVNELDAILGDCIPKTTLLDSKKIAAILKEYNPIILQKHLLVSTVKNQLLNQQLDTANGVEVGLRSKLDKAVEDNEDLRFVLKNATIELEGTKARVRILEEVHKLNSKTTSPDIIPDLDVNSAIANHDLLRAHSRTEIRTASMKAMSPLPINLQMDHSSSTESAHDQAEINRNKESTKRRPSKIPLKSYTAPKPPGGKHSPAQSRSRSGGDSPHRSHSSHSWRNRSSGGGGGTDNSMKSSLCKSRNSSLVSARDSLSYKLRSTESVVKNSTSPTASNQQQGTLKKTPSSKWTNFAKDEKISHLPKRNGNSLPLWTLSSYNTEPVEYPDSLINNKCSIQDDASSKFDANAAILWNSNIRNNFYDSIDTIDSNLVSANCFYRSHGEDLAECDSLERKLLTNLSIRNN